MKPFEIEKILQQIEKNKSYRKKKRLKKNSLPATTGVYTSIIRFLYLFYLHFD